jgi:hypothetical protein
MLIATLREPIQPIRSRNNENEKKKNINLFSFLFKKKSQYIVNDFLNEKKIRYSLVVPNVVSKFHHSTPKTFPLKNEDYDVENRGEAKNDIENYASGKSGGGRGSKYSPSNWGGSQMGDKEIADLADAEDKTSKSKGKGAVDDGVSMLTADEYIVLRLTPQLANFMVKTPPLHRFSSSVTAIIIIFSGKKLVYMKT